MEAVTTLVQRQGFVVTRHFLKTEDYRRIADPVQMILETVLGIRHMSMTIQLPSRLKRLKGQQKYFLAKVVLCYVEGEVR